MIDDDEAPPSSPPENVPPEGAAPQAKTENSGQPADDVTQAAAEAADEISEQPHDAEDAPTDQPDEDQAPSEPVEDDEIPDDELIAAAASVAAPPVSSEISALAAAGTAKVMAGAWKQRLAEEPWHHDYFWAVGQVEALHIGKPRIGDSASRRDEYLDLGQVPFMEFAASNVATFDPGSAHVKPRLRVKFLGLLGPMGPLPLSSTDEALQWYNRREDAFVRFLDIFNNRFLQLFYRAHADVRPAYHVRRPLMDRFRDYVGSTVGIGNQTWRDMDTLPDFTKLAYAGLLGPRGVSASRIKNLIAGVFGIQAEVEEFVGTYLPVAPEEQTQIGAANAGLGTGAMCGTRVLTVDTRFRLSLHVASLAEYERFLPGGRWANRLVDALSNAVGFEYDWEVELVLPETEVQPTKLGTFGRLGLTTWVRDPSPEESAGYVRTRFSPIDDETGRMLT
ncbi:MAG: type VI secretion system baseplate subunit TssG [Pseudomonadota bacterium]